MSEETTTTEEAPAATETKTEAKTYDGKVGDIIEALKGMTLLEISELKKAFEDTFDVTAAAGGPVMMAGPVAGGDAGGGEPAEEKTEFDVVLTSAGDKKIQVIKALREIATGLGLKEAKDLADNAPKTVLEGVDKAAADEAKEKLEAAGGGVEVK